MEWLFLFSVCWAWFVTSRLMIYIKRIFVCKRFLGSYGGFTCFPGEELTARRKTLVDMLMPAGVMEKHISREIKMDNGRVIRIMVPVLASYPEQTHDIVIETGKMLERAVGIYRNKVLQTLTPTYWMKSFLFWPSMIFEKFASGSDSRTLKVLIAFWWLAVTGVCLGAAWLEIFDFWSMVELFSGGTFRK